MKTILCFLIISFSFFQQEIYSQTLGDTIQSDSLIKTEIDSISVHSEIKVTADQSAKNKLENL